MGYPAEDDFSWTERHIERLRDAARRGLSLRECAVIAHLLSEDCDLVLWWLMGGETPATVLAKLKAHVQW